MRFVAEFEVEITDITAAESYAIAWSSTDDGEVRLVSMGDDEEKVAHAVRRAFSNFMDESGHRFGIRYVTGVVDPRPIANGHYSEITFGEARVRRADGSYSDEDN